MRKSLFIFFCFVLSLAAMAQPTKHNNLNLTSLPALSVGTHDTNATPQGVSGAFAGTIGNNIVVCGGCNFPGVPAAEGGSKVFYDDVFALDVQNGKEWTACGHLKAKLAYGAAVTTKKGMVCIGGFDGQQSSAEVFLLNVNDGKVTTTALPSLPLGVDNFAAAYDEAGGTIYVVGGQHSAQKDGVLRQEPSLVVYSLKVDGGKSWETLSDKLDSPRLQPCASIQNGSTGANLYVFGGYNPAPADGAQPAHTDGLIYNIGSGKWSKTAPMLDGKVTLVGANCVNSGSQHILCFGGVDRDIFNQALTNKPEGYMTHTPDWYRFRSDILVYNTITGAWSTFEGGEPLARAGANVVTLGGEWYVVCGETMPGVRSTSVTSVEIKQQPNFGWLNWSVLVLYLLGMIALGYYFMKRESGADDFFKGGGRIPWWAAGISIYATMLSAITYMAYPAKAFATDWCYYPMLVTILIVSFPVCHYYLPFFRRLNVTTAYEYLERRFNAVTRLMASALFIVFMVARMALVLYLPSLALTAVTGIDIYICIVLMAVITILYCTMGGVEAVVWGDVVQGFILVGGAIFAVVYLVCGTEGGFSGFLDIASADDKFRLFDWSLSYKSATFWVIIIGGMANNLISYTSDQTVIQRYLTTKDEGEARRSIMMNGIMSVFVSIAFFAIGAGLYTFFKTHPAEMDITMAKNDIIFPFFMMSQLPAGLAGLLIAAIFAATMSTISSNINSVATAFSVDFYKRFRPTASDKSVLSCARYTCIISGVFGMAIALLMATWDIQSLLDFFQEILGLLSSGLGGLFLVGIFFPRIGGKAALVGFVSGVASVFLTKYYTETSFLLYGAIGMCVSVVVAYTMSFLLREPKAGDGLTWSTLKK